MALRGHCRTVATMTGDVLNSAAGTIGLGGSLAAGWSAEGVSMLGKVWVDGEVVAVDGPVECNPDLGEVPPRSPSSAWIVLLQCVLR